MSDHENLHGAPAAPASGLAHDGHEAHAGEGHPGGREAAHEPAWPVEDDAVTRPYVAATDRAAPVSGTGSKRRPLVWVGAAAMTALAAVFGYEMLKPVPPKRLEAELAVGKARIEPVPVPVSASVALSQAAEPATRALAGGGSASSAMGGSADGAATAVASQPAASAALALWQSAASSASMPGSAPTATPPGAPTAAGDASAAKLAALSAVEARLDQLTTALRDQGYLKPGTRLDAFSSDALLPYPGVATARASAVAKPVLASARASGHARRSSARTLSRARHAGAPVATAPSQPAGASAVASPIGVQLMAVDLWNGTPSAVIGTTTPGDGRIKVMQPGDVINGVQLRGAQADGQRATFGVRGSADSVSLVVGQ
jgi:Meckel syndrome type 1 protein